MHIFAVLLVSYDLTLLSITLLNIVLGFLRLTLSELVKAFTLIQLEILR